MWPFKKRSAAGGLLGMYLSGAGELPDGYIRLTDTPEVSACIDRIAGIISSATIYLEQNTKNGDKRLKNRLSRFVDIDPWPGHGTRQTWMSWIVRTMLGDGDGNALVFPKYERGEFTALVPMVNTSLIPAPNGDDYFVQWRGATLSPENVLHFRLFADEMQPWKGRGYRVQAQAVAESLQQTNKLKYNLSSPKYKPPLLISVNSDSPLSDPDKRDEFRQKYFEGSDEGKPWILPADLMTVSQIKPLTLNDLAVRDTMELDKKTVASIFGVPPFLLGIGKFDQDEYNNFIRTVVLPICEGIEQELTLKLLISDELYFQFNRRRLYAYDMKNLVDMDLAMSDRGFMTGDEVREDACRDPAGLNEFRVLENYIPWEMSGKQKKLLELQNELEDKKKQNKEENDDG